MVTFKEILELIDKVAGTGIASLEIEQGGVRLRIEGKSSQPQIVHVAAPLAAEVGGAPPGAAPQSIAAPLPLKTQHEQDVDAGLHIITSPIVGTFYRSPNPESESFVNVGDHIAKGKVLCIIEAMKLMNEIESDIDGEIARVYPQNGQPIEYGEKLFAVKV